MFRIFLAMALLALANFSSIALAEEPDFYPANQIPTLELERMDAEAAGRLGEMPFYDGGLDFDFEEKAEIDLFDDNSCGNRLYVEYTKSGFTNVTGVQNWCNGFMTQFGINSDRFNDHCGWSRSGSYGRYNYAGIFIYAVEYSGAPRFYFERYCNDGGGGGGSGGYDY